MAVFTDFEEILAWQKAKSLAKEMNLVTNQNILQKDSSLSNQISRSAGSIMDNIAEGFGRGGNREFILFLFISRASATELRSQLNRALDFQYISSQQFQLLREEVIEIEKILSGLIRYLKSKQDQNFKDSI